MRFFSIFILIIVLAMPVSLASNTIRPGTPDTPQQQAAPAQVPASGNSGANARTQDQQNTQTGSSDVGGENANESSQRQPSASAPDQSIGNSSQSAQEAASSSANVEQTSTQSAQESTNTSANAGQTSSQAAQESANTSANAGQTSSQAAQESANTSANAGQTPSQAQSAMMPGTPAQDNAEGKFISITAIGKPRNDISGQPLVIPKDTNDISFLEGQWSFDKEFMTHNGDSLRADFLFDGNGRGKSLLTDQNGNYYIADTEAIVEDGTLRMRTSNFKSNTRSEVYNSEYIECVNGASGAECYGTDGFGVWNNERMFSAATATAGTGTQDSSSQPALADNASPLREQAEMNQQGLNSSPESGKNQSKKSDEHNYAELAADGPEMAPAIMEQSAKATADKNGPSLGALEGDWRYSQDLARKSDGASIGLEFHFDKDGNGYSLIKDGSGKDFRAAAQSAIMPNGTIRVKTDAYENGTNRAYYPTFMECSAKAAEELNCNVSNGWMRIENGRLVSLKSYEQNRGALQMEELLPSVPAKTERKESDVEDILASVTPPASAQAKNKSQSGKAAQSANLVLPQDNGNSISFMQGKWLCQTGLASMLTNEPIVMEFAFDRNGKGTGTVVEQSGKAFRASAQASYRNGTLRINTSEYYATKGQGAYNKTAIECQDDNGYARCFGKNSDNTRWDAIFIRK